MFNGSEFPIVGLGASAGGLPAFEAFFTEMSIDSEMAFVLVQHMSPNHESILSELIKKYTTMKVFDVIEGITIEPNRIYIMPPNKKMTIRNGKLFLKDWATEMPNLPIDSFFRSLAIDQQEQAIGILLSGSGTDGMLGIKAIKSEGGMAMAQDSESAEHDSMPRSAISTGMVDYVIPPEAMPEQLISYIQHKLKQFNSNEDTASKNNNSLQSILDILYAKTGHNFSDYKQNTICRRIERRLAVNQIENMDHYIHYLEQNPLEVEALFQEFLIGVTHFFRDTEAFEVLESKIIPSLFKGKKSGEPLRIRVPGCSTGEEAYSIAILIQEYLEKTKQSYNIQIFATDIDSLAIEKARNGIFPANIAVNISKERLSRYFNRTLDGNSYQILKNIREMLVFAEQNLIIDPPFSRMDLISCRNLLIYFGVELQKKVFHLFHYALNYESFLFLGSSETIGQFEDIFTSIDKKHRIYQSKGAVAYRIALQNKSPSVTKSEVYSKAENTGRKEAKGIGELVEQTLLQNYAPACVVINKRGEIIYIHGRTGKFLELQPGEAKMNIVLMAREGLRLELNHAISKVAVTKEPMHYKGLKLVENNHNSFFNLSVSPIQDSAFVSGMMMVVFEDIMPLGTETLMQEAAATNEIINIKDERYMAMERELVNKEEYLQTTIEELETSNEELQSTNEELQSTNEELETSKEELQSVNEELLMVNVEQTNNLEELSRANNDINNMLSGTGVGTIFLDDKLRIKRFTSVATKVINLIENDIGRTISHIATNLKTYNHIDEDINAVLDTLVPKVTEVQTKDEMWYSLRILPYRTVDNIIEGTVITLIDITEQKQTEVAMERLATIVRDSTDAITMIDLNGQILTWNPGAEIMYGWSEAQALRMNVKDIEPNGSITEILETNKLSDRIKPFQTQRICRNGMIVDIWLTASLLVNETREPYAIVTIERKI